MSDFVKRYEGNLFVQVDPSDPYFFVTCTGVGNITIPKGTRTIKYKQDLRRSGQLVAAGAIQSVADFVTASITRPLSTVNNYLQEISCPFNARINWACRGARPILTNYEVAALLYDASFTTGAVETPVAGEGDNDRINTTGEFSATRFTYVYALAGARQPQIATTEVYALVVVPSECASKCGDKVGLGQIVWAGLESTAYTVGYLIYTDDYGATWQAPVNQPFSVAGDVSSMVIVDTQTGYRLICGRGSIEGGNPAEISYSDNEGDTFTDVNVGATNGQTIQALFRDAIGRIWAAASGGYVYRSNDLGITWTAQATGAPLPVDTLNDICFYDENVGYAVGNTNAFIYTTNGSTFGARTGPAPAVALLSVAVNYAGHVYVSTADARLFRSVDGGVTWEIIIDLAVGSINQIRFDDDFRYFGYLAWDDASPVGTVMRSEDAGNTWAAVGTPATDYLNAGINCVAICDANMLYAGGPAQGGTSFIAVFNRKP